MKNLSPHLGFHFLWAWIIFFSCWYDVSRARKNIFSIFIFKPFCMNFVSSKSWMQIPNQIASRQAHNFGECMYCWFFYIKLMILSSSIFFQAVSVICLTYYWKFEGWQSTYQKSNIQHFQNLSIYFTNLSIEKF